MFFSMKDKRLFPQAGEFKQLSMRGWQWCLCCWVADLCVKNPLKDERNQSWPLEGSRRWLLVCWWWQMKPNGFEGGWAAQRVTGEQSNGRPWVSFGMMTYVLPINLHTREKCHENGNRRGWKRYGSTLSSTPFYNSPVNNWLLKLLLQWLL